MYSNMIDKNDNRTTFWGFTCLGKKIKKITFIIVIIIIPNYYYSGYGQILVYIISYIKTISMVCPHLDDQVNMSCWGVGGMFHLVP